MNFYTFWVIFPVRFFVGRYVLDARAEHGTSKGGDVLRWAFGRGMEFGRKLQGGVSDADLADLMANGGFNFIPFSAGDKCEDWCFSDPATDASAPSCELSDDCGGCYACGPTSRALRLSKSAFVRGLLFFHRKVMNNFEFSSKNSEKFRKIYEFSREFACQCTSLQTIGRLRRLLRMRFDRPSASFVTNCRRARLCAVY